MFFIKRGFTLIEILISLGIFLTILSIVIASISSARLNSRDAKRISDINQIRLVLEQYYDACGQYPQTLTTNANTGCSGSTTFGSFMSQIPTDPGSSAYYYYPIGTSGVCYTYHISATLENSGHRELQSDSDYAPTPAPNHCTTGVNTSFQAGTDPRYDGAPGK